MSDSSLDCGSKVVLKLDLGDRGGVRRIPLNRLWEKNEVSFQKLRDLAIELHGGSSKEAVFTYKDEDGDSITISSNEELMEAFIQFVDKVPPVLRATATFVPASTSNHGGKEQGPPPEFVLKVIDNINEALAHVIDNFQKRIPIKEKVDSSPVTDGNEASITSMNTNELAGLDELSPKKVDCVKSSVFTSTTLRKSDVDVEKKKKPQEPELKEPEKKFEEKLEEKSEKKPQAKEKKPIVGSVPSHFDIKFIHGRHTCDGCLVTPIVGFRYHATNLPDYDLCQHCVIKKKDENNVIFEPVQNDRDLHFQYRWKRRQQRLARQSGNCKYYNHNRHKKEQEENDEDDADLKEAIRQSRQSLLLKETKKECSESESKDNEHTLKESKKNEAKLQESDHVTKGSSQENVLPQTDLTDSAFPVSPEHIASIMACIASLETSSTATDQFESNGQEGNVAVTDTSAPSELSEKTSPEILTLDTGLSSNKSVSTVEKEVTESQDYDSVAFARKEEVEIVSLSSALSDMSNSELVNQDLLEKIETLNSEEDNEFYLTENKDCVETSFEKETSFSSDAEGQGDMALAIGETLDKCATEINAIVAEVDSMENEETKSMDDGKCSLRSFQSQDDDVTSASGRTILNSVPTSKADDILLNNKLNRSSSEDDWQVLEDSQQIQDEMIARAAQMLGSALFSSELHSEDLTDAIALENESENKYRDEASFLTPGSSVVSSVPDSTKSAISAQVLARWDKELIKLHELGFLDDYKNVDTLERLEAANIGSDSKDPVTVEQAVNELLMCDTKKDVN